ncbi:MAG: hypothetical protein B5M56_09480 [Desulfococcus sp. 4484_241]|nr:MAG: hypothetical protein B5M56_09480 [Desulfococcus sp. 4484_241]
MGSFKVLLVMPKHTMRFMTVEVPLGPLYLASFLKRELGSRVDVRFVDLRLSRRPLHTLAGALDGFGPDLVGFSLFSSQDFAGWRRDYLSVVRLHAPNARIVIGGPYPSANPEQAVTTCSGAHCAVMGEGEMVFARLVRAMMEGDDFRALDGVAYMDNGTPVCNPRGPFIEDLDILPFPDYGLIDTERYQSPFFATMNGVVAEKRHILVMSSRGCPFHCAYCHDIFGKRARVRSVENFMAEIRMLYDKYGIREFQIVDDIFNLDRKRMHAILEAVIQSGMKVKLSFPNGLRGDLLTREDILLLKRAGAYMITFAVESASVRIQKLIKKNLDIEKVSENIRYAHEAGLITKGFFMLGFPTETVEEIKKTVSLATSLPLDFATFFSVAPFPGTRLYELALKTWPDMSKAYGFDFYPDISAWQAATGVNLKAVVRMAHLRFYLPLRIVRSIFKAPLKSRILLQAGRAAWKILSM